MNEIKKDIERKIRETKNEFGEDALRIACLLVPVGSVSYMTAYIAGLSVIQCATIDRPTLGFAEYKTTRFFEDI